MRRGKSVRAGIRKAIAKIVRTQLREWWRERKRSEDLAPLADEPWDDFPRAINGGWCGGFAEELVERLTKAKFHDAHALDQADFITSRSDDHSHCWVLCLGVHYDAEAPEGVEDWADLPFFRRRRGVVRRRRSKEEDRARALNAVAAMAFVRGFCAGIEEERNGPSSIRRKLAPSDQGPNAVEAAS